MSSIRRSEVSLLFLTQSYKLTFSTPMLPLTPRPMRRRLRSVIRKVVDAKSMQKKHTNCESNHTSLGVIFTLKSIWYSLIARQLIYKTGNQEITTLASRSPAPQPRGKPPVLRPRDFVQPSAHYQEHHQTTSH
jgi:hypothetical protein